MSLASFHRAGDATLNVITELSHGIRVTFNVPARHGQCLVAELVTHHEGVGAGLAGICPHSVPEVMQAGVLQSSTGSDATPGAVQGAVGERTIWLWTYNDPLAGLLGTGQQCRCLGAKANGTGSGLAVRKPRGSDRKIDVLPLQGEHLANTTAGES